MCNVHFLNWFHFSSSAENDAAVSFRFRAENKLPLSALVSFSAEYAKPGFGRSLFTTLVTDKRTNKSSTSSIQVYYTSSQSRLMEASKCQNEISENFARWTVIIVSKSVVLCLDREIKAADAAAHRLLTLQRSASSSARAKHWVEVARG